MQFPEGAPTPASPALPSAPFFSAALNPPVSRNCQVFFNPQVPRGIRSTCLSAFVTRPLPLPRARSPASPSAHLPSFLSVLIAEPFLLHVWHVPCVCRLSCSLPAPFQDRTKERKGWPWLHSLLLLMNAGAKTAGPCKHFC